MSLPRPSRRFLPWLCLGLVLAAALQATSLLPLGSAQQALAQENAAAPAAPAAEGDEPVVGQQQTVLEYVWGALGIEYTVVFLGLSFVFVALLVMNILTARRDNVCPMALVEQFEAHLDEKQYQEAFELAKNDESFLAQVLAAGLQKLSAGYPQAIEAMQEVGEEENMKMEHRLSYMALIGTLAPMVGLFGTVDGMIRSFMILSTPGVTPKPWELAKGVSTALLTTLIGLAIAIPAIAAFNIIKNRIQRLVLEVGVISENLMSRFQTFGGAVAK